MSLYSLKNRELFNRIKLKIEQNENLEDCQKKTKIGKEFSESLISFYFVALKEILEEKIYNNLIGLSILLLKVRTLSINFLGLINKTVLSIIGNNNFNEYAIIEELKKMGKINCITSPNHSKVSSSQRRRALKGKRDDTSKKTEAVTNFIELVLSFYRTRNETEIEDLNRKFQVAKKLSEESMNEFTDFAKNFVKRKSEELTYNEKSTLYRLLDSAVFIKSREIGAKIMKNGLICSNN